MRFAFRKPIEKRKRQAGFTLIEGMVVTAIVLLLAGMLIMALGNQPDSTELAVARNDAKVLNTLMESVAAAGGTVTKTDVPTIIGQFDGGGMVVVNAYSGASETYRLPEGFDATRAAARLEVDANGSVVPVAAVIP